MHNSGRTTYTAVEKDMVHFRTHTATVAEEVNLKGGCQEGYQPICSVNLTTIGAIHSAGTFV